MKRVLKIFIMLIFVSSLVTIKTFAGPEVNMRLVPNMNNPVPGEDVSVNLFVESTNEINIATFRLKINFDNTKFKYMGLNSNFGTDDFKAYVSDNTLTIIYLTSETGVDISPNSPTNFVGMDFQVLSTAEASNTTITAGVDGIGNYEAVEFSEPTIKPENFSISNVPASDCNLKSLVAEEYEIKPNFSTSVTQYYVTVPYDKSTINITAETNDSKASLKVSKKTLEASGKTTDVLVTVTGSDKKSKKVYTVTVKRNSKDSAGSNSSSKNPRSGNSNKSGVLDSTGLKNDPSAISLIKGNFNFILFFIIMAICITVAIFIINKKNKK